MVLGVWGLEVYGFKGLGFSQVNSETFGEGSLHTSTPRFRFIPLPVKLQVDLRQDPVKCLGV